MSYLTSKLGKPTGIQFVDSTKIEVYPLSELKEIKCLKALLIMVKGTMGWSIWIQTTLNTNHLGEIVLKLTTAMWDDR